MATTWEWPLLPRDWEPGSTAVPNVRNNHPSLDFDQTTPQFAVWTFKIPTFYAGSGFTVEGLWVFGPTSGTLQVSAAIERINPGGLDIDADNFATAQVNTGTANATSGKPTLIAIAFSSGQIGGAGAGEWCRVKIARDVSVVGNVAGLAQLLGAVVKDT